LLYSIAEQIICKLSINLNKSNILKFKQIKNYIIAINNTDLTMQILRGKIAEVSVYNRATQLKPLSSNVNLTIV
jgi:hypothetical protein